MKYLLLFTAIMLGTIVAIAQPGPTLNYAEILEPGQLKGVRTVYYASSDTTEGQGCELYHEYFDTDGKRLEMYIFTFWDVVSYDHTYTYKYDTLGNCIEKTITQRYLNLNKSDSAYFAILGDEPINKKHLYKYNRKGQLVEEVEYSFGSEGFDPVGRETCTIQFQYNKRGQLVKEIGSSPHERSISYHYVTDFKYSKAGQLIQKRKKYTKESNYISTTAYQYNSEGQLIEEQTIDTKLTANNRHWRYEYDKNGRKSQKLAFSEKDGVWIVAKKFEYFADGRQVLSSANTTFSYYDNGLVKQELWNSPRSGQVVNFVSAYEFY